MNYYRYIFISKVIYQTTKIEKIKSITSKEVMLGYNKIMISKHRDQHTVSHLIG
ncbi:hypothetical protein ACSBO6_17210 [Bacillus sp. AL-1R]